MDAAPELQPVTLAEAARAFRVGTPDPDAGPDPEELLTCLPTVACEHRLQAAQAHLDALPESQPEARAQAQRAVTHWASRVRVAQERDRQLRAREVLGRAYLGCVCLGYGGAGLLVGCQIETPIGRLAAQVDGRPVLVRQRICTCPDGQAHRAARDEAVARSIEQFRARRVARIAGAAGIPKLYEGLTVESWAEAAATAGGRALDIGTILALLGAWETACRPADPDDHVTEATSRLLYLGGNHGTGKSGLAAALARAWVERERSVLYRTVAQCASELRAAPWRHRAGEEDAPTEGELLGAYQDAELVVLDDLGAEAMTFTNQEKLREGLFMIVDGRARELLPTIVTTNLTSEELVGRYGRRLADRLTSGRLAFVLWLDGPDLRATPA